jgi:hypothetical protein
MNNPETKNRAPPNFLDEKSEDMQGAVDEMYDDPSCTTMIIKASDGVSLHVSKYLMMTVSSVLRATEEIAGSVDGNTVIELNYESEDIINWLSTFHATPAMPELKQPQLHHIGVYMLLCLSYDMGKLLDVAKTLVRNNWTEIDFSTMLILAKTSAFYDMSSIAYNAMMHASLTEEQSKQIPSSFLVKHGAYRCRLSSIREREIKSLKAHKGLTKVTRRLVDGGYSDFGFNTPTHITISSLTTALTNWDRKYDIERLSSPTKKRRKTTLKRSNAASSSSLSSSSSRAV